MSFREYINKEGEAFYCFEGEEYKLPGITDGCRWERLYIKMPPNPVVVTSTAEYMTEDPVLDSLKTIYELDRVLDIEASTARELKELEVMRKNF